jgi:hypothetical protein
VWKSVAEGRDVAPRSVYECQNLITEEEIRDEKSRMGKGERLPV